MKNEARQIIEFVDRSESKLCVVEERQVFGKLFRIYGDYENPYFLASDVANWIEHTQPSKLVQSVDTEEKLIGTIFLSGQNRECLFLTEDGMYEVLMQSRKPIAKRFKKKVKEILRTIRKTGGYSVKPTDELRQKNIQIREQNAKIRTAQLLYKIADTTETDYRQVLHARITHLLTGEYLLPLPAVDERTYSAAEIGEKLGVTACRIGRLANLHGLKTAEYGKYFYDKAKTADKQVETFRYYEKAVDAFRKLVSGVAV